VASDSCSSVEGSFSQRSISSRVIWLLDIGFCPIIPIATSSSAIPCTSSGCISQNFAIWLNVSVVFSTSHTAVAFGINSDIIVFPGT